MTIAYSTADGTARAGEDYVAAAGTVVNVVANADRSPELDETFTLVLGNGAIATARVLDDDAPVRKGRSVRH